MEHFSTWQMPAEGRRSYWCDLVAETFPGMTVDADEGIRADLSRWTLGCVGMAVPRSERARVRRRPGGSTERHLVMHIQRRGRLQLSQCGRTAIAFSGGILIADDSEPYVIDISDRNECLVLDIPLHALGEEAERQDWRAAELNADDPNVALFRRMIDGLWDEARRHDRIDQGFDTVLLSMVRVACSKPSLLRETRQADAAPIAFALRHLFDPYLTTAAIAEGLGMSARGVQKAFLREVGQTPMAFVADRRLAHAAEMLGRDGRSVTEIAFDVGFSDSSTFSRSFRRRYDVAPSRWSAAAG
jgi:AraC-like DNA-binding protein